MSDGIASAPALYVVRTGWQVAHVVRCAQEVALCGRPMPDRSVVLRSPTAPAGTDVCVDCLGALDGEAPPSP